MIYWEPTCDTPPDGVNYVSSANLRSTLDIVWGSATILILCTWSVLHLNIPVQVRSTNFRQYVARKLYFIGRKVCWGIFTLISPEFVLGKAIIDRWSAAYSQKRMQALKTEDGVDWTTSHALFANMGGWYLKFGPDLPVSEDKTDELVAAENVDVEEELARAKTAMRAVTMPNLSLHPAKLEEGVQHASTDTAIFMGNASSRQTMMNRVATYIVPSSGTNPVGEHMTIPEGELKYEASLFKRNVSSMGNVLWKQDEHLFGVVKEVQIPETNLLRFKNMWQKSLTNMGTDTWPLDAEQLYLCRKMGLIRKLPDISEEDIKDRSKSDFLVEAIAVTQLLWFCIQLIGRAVEHLAITQLEIFVLAFATCSALTYLLHLKKPKDIMNPYYISAVRYPTSKEVYTIASRGSVDFGLVQKYQCVSGNAIHRCLDNVDQRDIFALLSLGSSSLFGALHLLAWNFHFPTNVELWLWRVASLYITIAPLFGSGTIVPVVTAVRHGAPRGLFKIRIRAAMVKLNISVVLFFGVLFTLCRVFILAEALRTLGYLEPSAFTQTWSVNLPHIG